MAPQATKKKSGPAAMSDEHKAALAKGRNEGRYVKAYLEALSATKPKRGRKRTADSVRKRLDKIGEEIILASPIKQLQLTQEKIDLQSELASLTDETDLSGIEDDFVSVAKGYSERKGISYAAWRALGVSPSVLKKAGISR